MDQNKNEQEVLIYTLTDEDGNESEFELLAQYEENGKLYYAGEEIVVEGAVTLYAEWEAKSDNDPRAVRTIKTAFQTFIRMIQTFLGVFEVFETPLHELTTAPTEAPTTQKPIVVPTEPDNK